MAGGQTPGGQTPGGQTPGGRGSPLLRGGAAPDHSSSTVAITAHAILLLARTVVM